MDWIPIVFVMFKLLVLGTGMFFAIKWHYDQGKKGKKTDTRALLRTAVMVAAGFVVLLAVVGFATFKFAMMLGIDLTLP
jgi:heme/copper-type cytochrome/quinol oxidase subunit 2